MVMSRIKVFAIVLRMLSILLMLGIVGVFLPDSTMNSVHQSLGLGIMPEGRIVDYLARMLSLFYALHGAILFFLSLNPQPYLQFLRFYLWLSAFFALTILAIDIVVGMPWYWTLFEGPFALLLVVILLFLLKEE
jgi:hypothetical protein